MEREKALEVALLQIEKQFGKGSVMRMGVDGPADPVQAISTGSLALDLALGIGGVPRGRVVEIYGPEASGKTTLARFSRPAPVPPEALDLVTTATAASPPWEARELACYRSILGGPRGARYRVVREFPLAG